MISVKGAGLSFKFQNHSNSNSDNHSISVYHSNSHLLRCFLNIMLRRRVVFTFNAVLGAPYTGATCTTQPPVWGTETWRKWLDSST